MKCFVFPLFSVSLLWLLYATLSFKLLSEPSLLVFIPLLYHRTYECSHESFRNIMIGRTTSSGVTRSTGVHIQTPPWRTMSVATVKTSTQDIRAEMSEGAGGEEDKLSVARTEPFSRTSSFISWLFLI